MKKTFYEEAEERINSALGLFLWNPNDSNDWNKILDYAKDYDNDKDVLAIIEDFQNADKSLKSKYMDELCNYLFDNYEPDILSLDVTYKFDLMLSLGGPSDGIEFYCDKNGDSFILDKAVYWKNDGKYSETTLSRDLAEKLWEKYEDHCILRISENKDSTMFHSTTF